MERKPILTESQANREPEELNLEQLTWGNLTWVNIEGPTERETEYLAQNYPFHALDLDDCLSRIQRPKIDEYEDYMFVILHFTVYDRKKRVSSHSQLSVFIGQKYLITLHSGELKTLVKLFRDCQINEESRRENFSNGPVFLLYRMLDRAVDSYFPILNKILDLMEQIEDIVFDEEVEAAQDLAILRRDIITQRRILFPMRAVMAELEVKLRRFSTVDMSVYFGDLLDHMNKICETLDECKELIEVYKDTDYVLSTEHINRIIRILTIISAILLPVLAISSLYGMNVHLPGGLTGGSYVSLIILIAVMLLFAGGMLYFFHRKHWI